MRRLNRLRLLLKSLISRDYRDYRFVQNLEIFDVQYYRSFLGDDEALVGDPLLAYFTHWRHGLHGFCRICRTWRQLPDPHPLFDTAFYLKKYFPHGLRRNPFAHYLRKGWKRGWRPSPYFDPDLYRQRTDWNPHLENPLSHYKRTGAQRAVSPSDFFDIDWYIDKTPVLNAARNWIIRHYKLYGSKEGEGKSPVPVFDPRFYLGQLPVDSPARRDPLIHYVTAEPKSGLRPGEWFDPHYYRKRYLRKHKAVSPLAHYLHDGVFSGHYTDQRIADLPYKPKISVIVPVYNTDHHFLNCCIRSVLYQAYPHWELCLVDDCSTDEELPQLLAQWSSRDARIKVAFHERNTGISGATTTGIDLAGGEYLGFLDHDDELSLDCLFQVAKRINETRAELYYTDEDLVGDDGSRQGVFHKPDYNRELLFSHNYITHFVVIKRELYDKLGGMTAEFDGAQDYNLVLRATEQTDQVIHIPEVLYHWRTAPSSTSIKHEEKPYAHEAGKRALTMSLARRAISAQVHDNHLNFHYRVAYSRTIEPSIAVLVCHHEEDGVSRSKAALLSEQAGYDNLELILLPQESAEKTRSQPERKAALLNGAIETCRSEYVVILNSMPVDISDLWLHHLAAPLFQDSNLAIVCGRVSFAGEDEQSYAVPNLNDRSERYFAAALSAMSRHLNGLHNPQLVRCCDWSLCLFPRAVYREAGGFDLQKFPYLLAMHDFSLTVFESGKKILYTPSATVDFGKQAQPGRLGGLSAITGEKELFQRKWRAVLSEPDPFYNTGILREQQIAYHRFQQWLTGEECLDETGKIH